MKILSIFGTRPEAIKMAPVIAELKKADGIESIVCVTGQHREMLDQMLSFFDLTSDYDLNLIQPNQTLTSLTALTVTKLEPILKELQPDWVLVQGDTTTAFASALAAFYQKILVAHVEAGLRTYNPYLPWPEEMNRKLISGIARLHFTPTEVSASHLIQENVSKEQIHTVGNTVIDTLVNVVDRFDKDRELTQSLQKQFKKLDWNKRLILVTGHRRESWDGGLERMCKALSGLAKRDDVEIVYPVHLNPRVQKPAYDILSGLHNIHLIEPLSYLPFVYLLSKCYLVITDSGGVQEEAPSLGKPILVTRDTTERPEGIKVGTAKLVGTDAANIIQAASELLDNALAYKKMSYAHNPYGDGLSSKRIVDILLKTSVVERNTNF